MVIDTDIETARSFLDTAAGPAYDMGDNGHAYIAGELSPRTVILVPTEDLADLGARLRNGQEDAYSTWCAETDPGERITAVDLAAELDDPDYSRVARAVAAREAGDYISAAGHALLGDDVEKLLEEV